MKRDAFYVNVIILLYLCLYHPFSYQVLPNTDSLLEWSSDLKPDMDFMWSLFSCLGLKIITVKCYTRLILIDKLPEQIRI
jgi:hypothetical protein